MRTIILTLVLLLLALPAYAYTPHAGDRAADLYGRDINSNTVLHLEDLNGQWVFMDFWASWCGPCMGELPNMIEKTKPWIKSGELALFTVSLDAWTTVDDLHDVLKEHGIRYPVIFDGNGWQTVQAAEWNIHSIPATFLVNPDGVIAATNLRGEQLGPALEFFLGGDKPYQPIGLRSSYTQNDDGTVTVRVELGSPTHESLKLKVDYWHTRYIYAEDDPEHENRPVDAEYNDYEDPDIETLVDFGEFADAVYEFTVPAAEDVARTSWSISVMIPGTEDIGSEDDPGIWINDSGRLSW